MSEEKKGKEKRSPLVTDRTVLRKINYSRFALDVEEVTESLKIDALCIVLNPNLVKRALKLCKPYKIQEIQDSLDLDEASASMVQDALKITKASVRKHLRSLAAQGKIKGIEGRVPAIYFKLPSVRSHEVRERKFKKEVQEAINKEKKSCKKIN